VTAPTREPIHLTEAKEHIRLTGTADDTILTTYVKAARRYCEQAQGRSYVTQVHELQLDRWPGRDTIMIPYPPLVSVTSITYTKTDGTTATVAAGDYLVDTRSEPGRITLDDDASWPGDLLDPGGGLVVRYVAGWATPVTADATADTLTFAGRTFANGDIVRIWNTGGTLPTGLSADTDYYVVSATSTTLKLSATSGGSAIDITGAGTGTNFLGEIPEQVRQAIRLLLAHWYENREALQGASNLPRQVDYALGHLLMMDQVHYWTPLPTASVI